MLTHLNCKMLVLVFFFLMCSLRFSNFLKQYKLSSHKIVYGMNYSNGAKVNFYLYPFERSQIPKLSGLTVVIETFITGTFFL